MMQSSIDNSFLNEPLVNKSLADSSLGVVKTISQSVNSSLEPVEIFSQLGQAISMTNSMLLESSEIESKANVKSILMLAAALRIECQGSQVVIKALTSNGENVLAHLVEYIANRQIHLETEAKKNQLSIKFTHLDQPVDEDSRLKALSPIEVLRLIKNSFYSETNNPYAIFLCGVFAFDFIATFEKLPAVPTTDNTCPDYVFYLAETLLVIDHLSNQKRLYANHFSGPNERANYFDLSRNMEQIETLLESFASIQQNPTSSKPAENPAVDVNLDDASYEQLVRDLKQNIVEGDVFQVVPSRTFSLPCPAPLESYRLLKNTNPSPYLFYMQDEDFILFGASPESALKYTSSDNQVLLYPIAGTRPRGKNLSGAINLDLDARLEAELKLDQKEVAEHMMLVDLARNDIARIAKPATTHVPKLLAVDRYSQVMHLVSCVQGQLRNDLDALHAYQACSNMGTLTGAPKIKATQLIREAEKSRRGSYGGAVGYLNGLGDMDTCIVIRSAFCRDGTAYVQAGAGIVYDSVPAAEALETRNKAQAVINAIHQANLNLAGSQS